MKNAMKPTSGTGALLELLLETSAEFIGYMKVKME